MSNYIEVPGWYIGALLDAWEGLPNDSRQVVEHDAPEPENGWTNPPHKSHLCHGCGCVWRPADVPTNGVAQAETRAERDTWPDVAKRPK